MTSVKISPPEIKGIRWNKSGDGIWQARITERFLDAELGCGEWPACMHSLNGTLHIHLVPNNAADEAEIAAWLEKLAARAARRAEVDAIVRKRYHDMRGPKHAAAVREAIAEAEALYAEYGPAVRRVSDLLRLTGYIYLSPVDLARLRKLITEIRAGLARMDEDAAALGTKPSFIPLDDAFVERGIRKLTALDQDRNRIQNDEGWGKRTSAPGHWCCALLNTDRARAIEIGRGLVSHHLVQLKKLGIVPAAVAAGRAAA